MSASAYLPARHLAISIIVLGHTFFQMETNITAPAQVTKGIDCEKSRMLFSANLGFLWTERPLHEAIYAAKAAGFDAVECHWPDKTEIDAIGRALDETKLPLLGLNTSRGDVSTGENGLCALPLRVEEARASIDQALDFAIALSCQNIHVMAGNISGDEAAHCFIHNLQYACDKAAMHDITILIEPLNPRDAPGYFLNDIHQARELIERTDRPNLKLMFDIYHMQLLHGEVADLFKNALDIIGHIQFASVPHRGAPDEGVLDFHHLFHEIKKAGYHAPLGAEYKPANGDTDASLAWLSHWQDATSF